MRGFWKRGVVRSNRKVRSSKSPERGSFLSNLMRSAFAQLPDNLSRIKTNDST